MLPTGSELPRAMACPASVTLPRVGDVSGAPAIHGIGVHAYLASLQTMPREAALDLVPPELRAACEAVDVGRLPLGLEYEGEVSLAYDVASERTRYLGRNLARQYGTLGPTEIAMTLDVLGVGEGEVVVADYKTGRGHVPSAAANWQLRIAALAAARWRGVDRARVAIIRVPETGNPWWDPAEFDLFDLDGFAAEVRGLLAELASDKPTVRPGEHCRYCPAFAACPAQGAIVRRMAGDPEALGRDISDLLTPETAARAYQRLKAVEEAVKRARAALYEYATATPIPLPDGTVFGRVESRVEEVDGEVARAVLRRLHGDEVADAACTVDTSKAAVERALRAVYEARKAAGEKVTIGGLVTDALEAIRAEGGVSEKVRVVFREHKP